MFRAKSMESQNVMKDLGGSCRISERDPRRVPASQHSTTLRNLGNDAGEGRGKPDSSFHFLFHYPYMGVS